MAMIINTNIASLNAQRNLTNTQNDLSVSLQRLSTGLRINSAKDDAAGLAISERFTTQIRGLNQAARNANDGISLAQTAEGALGEVTNNLQRIRELAVQARNATNSASDREALDAEVQQRINEINRVANQTEFNGLKVLDGTFTEQVFQVGANQGQTISVDSIASVTSQALGLAAGTTTVIQAATGGDTAVTGALTDGDLTINGTAINASVDGANGAAAGEADSSAFAIAAAINGSSVTGVTATATTVVDDAFVTVTGAALADGNDYTLTINDVELFNNALGAGQEVTADDVMGLINDSAELAALGITATVDGDSGNLVITAEGGRDIIIAQTFGDDLTDTQGLEGTTSGTVALTSDAEIEIAGNDPTVAGLTAGTVEVTETEVEVTGTNVLTTDAADAALTTIDAALTIVNGSRADLGAVQNRFESVIASLTSASESLAAARSRILDADFAAETAALTRAQILQQAGVAILAQANALPQLALSLLQ